MENRVFNYLQLALSILVMSSSGALGKYISLPVPMIIWGRCALGVIGLYAFLKIVGANLSIGWGRELKMIILSSVLMGIHWLTYFWSLKLSNVAIAMLSLFTYPVITAVLEPLFTKSRFHWQEVGLAFFAFLGVFFLVPDFSTENNVTLGILVGIFSAIVYSLRNIILKQSIAQRSGTVLMYYQLLIVAVLLTPVWLFYPVGPSIGIIKAEWIQVLLLAYYTTALGHTLLVRSFKHFRITTISIITCLTPVLGILQAYLFLDEKPTHQILIGGSIIMLSVTIESIRSIRQS